MIYPFVLNALCSIVLGRTALAIEWISNQDLVVCCWILFFYSQLILGGSLFIKLGNIISKTRKSVWSIIRNIVHRIISATGQYIIICKFKEMCLPKINIIRSLNGQPKFGLRSMILMNKHVQNMNKISLFAMTFCLKNVLPNDKYYLLYQIMYVNS